MSALKKRVFVRKLVGIIAAAGLVASLSACSSAPSTFASCDASGNAKLVTAEGKLNQDPQATFPTPLIAHKTELDVVQTGKGEPVSAHGVVDTLVSIYDGKTGDALQGQNGPLVGVGIRSFVVGKLPFTQALSCAPSGSRVVITGTAAQLLGKDALGLKTTATLVIVADIAAAYIGKANGVDQLAVAGMPSIVLAPDGEPGFTFGSTTAPTDLAIAQLKAGNGQKVQEGDNVILNYSGVLWGAKELFDSSWTNQAPATLLASPLAADGTGVVPGFAKAIIGQRIGSQVLVVIPPGKYGYPAGSAPSGVPDGSTMVFVIDILGINK